MGNDANEVVESLPNPLSFKVHRTMCTKFMKLVDRISRVFPDIEAARPRCSSGIQTLCLLNSTINRAKQLLQYCSESSKLYLAITGNAVLSRFQRAKRSLEQSLGAIQNMVPVMLAAEISRIIDDLQSVTFILDSAEDEAGKVVRELLQQDTSASDSMKNSEYEALKFAAARLNITSQKAIVTEKISIKKLLDNVGSNDSSKKMVLGYLLYLLKRYEKLLKREQMAKVYTDRERPIASENSTPSSLCGHYIESDPCSQYDQHETCNSEPSRPLEEYKCPISSRVMYDPVIIASGVTYEKMWIKKWFDEGNDFCPKTRKKLSHMSLTPNIVMKDLISKWCRNNGVTIPDPSRKDEDFHSWEVSSSSIRSIGSLMNDLHLPDLTNMSIGSLDSSYTSDSSNPKISHGLNSTLANTNENSGGQQTQVHMPDTDLMLLSKLPDLQWDFQCQVIEKLKSCFKGNCQAFDSVSSEKFIESLIRFLRDAYDLHDVRALRSGTQVLLEFITNCSDCVTYFTEDTFSMLASFLDSEVTGEALAIMEELSGYAKIVVTDALPSILMLLGSQCREFQQRAVRILYNLSFNGQVCSHLVSLDCIPKLLLFLGDRALVRYYICILKNLCDTAEGRNYVVETKGCLPSIAQILENGGNEEQEHALDVLLSLCSERVEYCQLVMHEGIIPSLVKITNKGNERGKVNALELLRLLKDVEYVPDEANGVSNLETSRDSNNQPQEKTSSKASGLLKKLLPKFSSHASKNNR